MISFIRRETSDGTYLMECGLEDVNHICNEEKTVPLDWITPEGSDVTEAFVRLCPSAYPGNCGNSLWGRWSARLCLSQIKTGIRCSAA